MDKIFYLENYFFSIFYCNFLNIWNIIFIVDEYFFFIRCWVNNINGFEWLIYMFNFLCLFVSYF